jgi:SAM-dependent methyltransferase
MNFFSQLRSFYVQELYINKVLRGINRNDAILEIGGGYNPKFHKELYDNAYHLDHCDTETLKGKYGKDRNVSHLLDNIQAVDFVSNDSSLNSTIPQELKFDYVYGSHVIEHQVDLVEYFLSIEKILKSGGVAIFVIPDLRTCFDRFRFPTVASDVISVHQMRHVVHQGKQIYEAFAQGVNLNPGRKIRCFDLTDAEFTYDLSFAYENMCLSENPSSSYKDAHAWTFTPPSFQLLVVELFLLELMSLEIVQLSPVYGNQFSVVMKKADSQKRIEMVELYKKNRINLSKIVYSMC